MTIFPYWLSCIKGQKASIRRKDIQGRHACFALALQHTHHRHPALRILFLDLAVRIHQAVFFPFKTSRLVKITSMSFLASSLQVYKPRPRLAPVTRAIFACIEFSLLNKML
ncbi:hypothetical protein PHSC3_000478 [Chlamydiales bacterium STE3]|nr:hypothetical protein PHSC3_000478 [Chlamydiales bacterium STE3]